ncbi:glycogen debranching enzyme [Jimgerdemannia flammicorona]|uniref:Glycogen debranching enzyme n=1 Tax=Jimgerdemannia flammicorona TaxID=994334 RepID=A0A433DL83_9FUNG|nr:glycogen debranching enzyme [Jimgerdemannia flammicorona]
MRKSSFTGDFSRDDFCDIGISQSGAFEYYVEHNAIAKDGKLEATTQRSTSGYFVVEPRLWIKRPRRVLPGKDAAATVAGEEATAERILLPIDGLVIESIVAKWMGPITKWDTYLHGIADAGYNMLHFVPIQKRGGSNSPYSIFDQLNFADDLFEKADLKSTPAERYEIVKREVAKFENTCGLMCLSDVVWNHTSYDSTWLWDHPEAGMFPFSLSLSLFHIIRLFPTPGYNMENSPHLIPAYELDTALLDFSANLAKHGLPTTITTVEQLDALMASVKDIVFKEIRLWEYYAVDVEASVLAFRQALADKVAFDPALYEGRRLAELAFKQQAETLVADALLFGEPESFGIRYVKSLDLSVAIAFVFNLEGVTGYEEVEGEKIESLCTMYQTLLDELNLPFYKEYDEIVKAITDNIRNRVEYQRLADHGPKFAKIDVEHPLVESYFTRLPVNTATKKHPKERLALVNNGWIWNANPLQDFAGSDSTAYLRRDVIVWGDCVKLRYGKGPEDSPWLWSHMRQYTEQVATLFQGIRIDNCHSTPLHVAEHLLDAARHIRPDLYVVAELFTGSEDMDVTFMSRLGINSLIREAMQAWDPRELSRLVHRHGGKPVGSMDVACMAERTVYGREGKEEHTLVVPLLSGSTPHALFMDCTHDNETPTQKRTPEDTLPNAALVAFSGCAIGSVKGYDEVYPELLDIVKESRRYEVHDKSLDYGIGKVKRILQRLHTEMTLDKYIEAHIHHENDCLGLASSFFVTCDSIMIDETVDHSQYIIVHRQHPETHQGYLLIAHTAFPGTESQRGEVSPVKLRGTDVELIFAAHLVVKSRENLSDKATLRGLPSRLESLAAPTIRNLSDGQGPYTEIVVPPLFPSGSVMLLRTWVENSSEDIHDLVSNCHADVFKNLNLVEMNIVLYRCEGEERDVSANGVYNIPGYGVLPYCGLEGFMSVLKPIMQNNDLGHAFCAHLREGYWALDYVVHRLYRHTRHYPALTLLRDWLQTRFDAVKQLPNFLVPKYFALIIRTVYIAARKHAISLMSPLIVHGDHFTHSLGLCSVQMYGEVRSASLHPVNHGPSMAAGLPHFAQAHMRCWGRDVFISLRGLFLTTGNFDAARRHIISFASSLKHGLIPNLLDSVRYPRYNSRDSVWWFLQAVQEYCRMAPEGLALLDEKVARRFPIDDTFVDVNDDRAFGYTSSVAEIVQEILQRHARGIHFREHNAGFQLDSQMSDNGFTIDIDVDWQSGLILGGSTSNCGTWMDKMGESQKAGTKGVPATPRDGAPVEISGLLKSTLRWVVELAEERKYAWNGVEIEANGATKFVTFKEWNDLIQKSFEKYYYVPLDPKDDAANKIEPSLVARRGIYKDTYGSSGGRMDYQLRPNFAVAMVVAPELFDPKRAFDSLQLARKVIAGPLGMRTLDPADPAYRPNYDNSNDSEDRAVAKGWNYHQGPEWVWCTGYFLRAYLAFDIKVHRGERNVKDLREILFTIHRALQPHKAELDKNAWAGLPELTNQDGAPCWDACPTQAWSAGTLLDLLDDMVDLYNKHRVDHAGGK